MSPVKERMPSVKGMLKFETARKDASFLTCQSSWAKIARISLSSAICNSSEGKMIVDSSSVHPSEPTEW